MIKDMETHRLPGNRQDIDIQNLAYMGLSWFMLAPIFQFSRSGSSAHSFSSGIPVFGCHPNHKDYHFNRKVLFSCSMGN